MTHCHPSPGTVGIAYVGALCTSYGVGLSNYLGTSTWEVLAHEVGHNFGSGHTFDRGVAGGIMDYGDGLLNGVYQFHPVHKTEVCQEISSSIGRRRSVPNCWATKTATAPSPEFGDIYQWRRSSNPQYGACSTTCGVGYQEEIIPCLKYDLDNCPSLTSAQIQAKNRGACSTDDFTGCSVTQVASSLCPAACRAQQVNPQPNVRQCPGLPACAGTCGDGIQGPNEVCDPGINQCCNSDCQSYKTTGICATANSQVDAAAVDQRSGRYYVFSGDKYSVYTNMNSATPLNGYPKRLNTIGGLNANYHDGIDAAAGLYNDLVFLFKGLTTVLIDLNVRRQQGQVYSANQFLSTDMRTCAQQQGISAIVSRLWEWDMICGDRVQEYSWSSGRGNVEVVTDYFGLNLAGVPSNIRSGISAAVRNPSTGGLRFFYGNLKLDLSTNGVTSVTQSGAALGMITGALDTGCIPENCAVCTADRQTCTVCNAPYTVRGDGLCKAPNLLLSLTFDESNEGWKASFASGSVYTAGGAPGSSSGLVTGEGAFDQGVALDGTKAHRLAPLPTNGPISDWRLSFWWKPTQLRREKLLTMNRVNAQGFTEEFSIWFAHESVTEPVANERFAIELFMYGQFLDCYVDRPIRLGQWNKIGLEFINGEFITSSNGLVHKVAMAGVGQPDDFRVQFTDWYIGGDGNGISGNIDNFEIEQVIAQPFLGGGAGTESEGTSTGTIILMILIPIIILAMIGFLWFYCNKRKKNQIAPELTQRANEMTGIQATTGEGSYQPAEDYYKPGYGAPPAPPTSAAPAPPTAPAPPKPSGLPPPPPGAARNSGRAPPPPGKKAPPPPPGAAMRYGAGFTRSMGRSGGLNLGDPQKRESWQI